MPKRRQGELSEREKLFCRRQLRLQNAREAAAGAGYGLADCRTRGENLMAREDIRDFLEKLRKEEGYSGRKILEDGLRRLAFGSAADCVRLAFLEEAPDQKTLEGMDLFSLSAFKRNRGVSEVKLYDRVQALEALAAILDRQEEEGIKPLYEALEQGANALRKEQEG